MLSKSPFHKQKLLLEWPFQKQKLFLNDLSITRNDFRMTLPNKKSF